MRVTGTSGMGSITGVIAGGAGGFRAVLFFTHSRCCPELAEHRNAVAGPELDDSFFNLTLALTPNAASQFYVNQRKHVHRVRSGQLVRDHGQRFAPCSAGFRF